MRFVIFGQCGLIGSALKKRLELEGHQCILEMDLRSGDDVIYDIENRKCSADIVFHLVAQCKINQCITNPEKAFENALSAHKILEFCRRNNIPKVVAFSSSRVLSKECNPYTASKSYLEELCKAYSSCYNLEYLLIRPSTVYGPFDDKTHRLVDIWIRAALNGNNLKLYGDPKTKTLDFTFIDDFINGVMLTLKKDEWNNTYNISGGEEYKLYDLAKFIIKETNSKGKIVIEDEEIQQPQKVAVDISKISKLGYRPSVNIEEGIKKTIAFYEEKKLR